MNPSLLTDPRLRPYLDDVRQWHGYVRFLGLPTMVDNPDTPLSELFVTPALSEQRVAPEAPVSSWPTGQSVLAMLEQRRRLVVLGDPGCGKSTLTNWLAWLLAGGAAGVLPAAFDGLLPLPMVARELKLEGVKNFDGLLDAFLERPVAERLRDQRGELLARMEAGGCVVFVDGLDEVPVNRRTALRDALREGAKRYPEVFFLVTSRVVGYDGCALQEKPLKAIEREFLKIDQKHVLTIRQQLSDLSVMQAVADAMTTWFTSYVMPFDDARIASFASQWYGLRSIRRIATQDANQFLVAVHANSSIEALARMPQLLTLMALVFKVGTRLPDGRAILYNQIAEAYLRSIDDARKLESDDDESPWEEKRNWLARVGFEMQLIRGRAKKSAPGGERELLVSRDKVSSWIRDAMKKSGYPTDADFVARYLDWVARRSGLLLPRGEELFAFVHLSFQEYFAALYLVEHLADVDWVIAQRDGIVYREGDRRITAKTIGEWGGSALWQEVFVFSSECFASKARDARRLSDLLFGKDLEILSEAIRGGRSKRSPVLKKSSENHPIAPRAELLARLATNAHSGWTQSERDRGLKLLVRYVDFAEEVAGTSSHPYYVWARPVLQRLLASEPARAAFWAWAEGKSPSYLDFLNAGAIGLSHMPALPALTHLLLSSVVETSLENLVAAAPALEYLFISDADDLAHLDALESLASLQVLSLGGLTQSQIESIGKLTSLKSLQILGDDITDLAPIANLTDLESLDIVSRSLRSIDPLRRLEKLQWLSMHEAPISSIEPLANLSHLRDLMLPRAFELPEALEKRRKDGTLTIRQ